jgi:long-chain acyl-CoA synthetase
MNRKQAIEKLTAAGLPYALEQGEINHRSCKIFSQAPATLRDLFADNRSDQTFFVYEDERYSFEEIYRRSAALAQILITDFNITKGDRVSISMRNYPEWIVSFMAVTSIGAIAVAMNALWQTDEIEYGLSHSGSKLLIADHERIIRALPVSEKLGISIISVRSELKNNSYISDFNDLVAKAAGLDMPQIPLSPDDDATIFYTSGSTGHPKGAVSCHRNIISALFSWELDLAARQLESGLSAAAKPIEQPATLLAVPLFHATGSHAVYLQSYRAQRKIVSMYKWDPAEAAALIEEEKISSFIAPAAMTGDLLEQARSSQRDLSSLISVGGGGAPRAPDQVKNIPGIFAQALPSTGWGMTETNAIGTGIGGEDYLQRPTSSGRCSAVLELKVVDEQGSSLPANTPGELWVRGSSVIRGYWQRPEANAESFHQDWLRTGDVALLDDEGFLYIVDRIKDLVIRGGENIGCAEVEAALLCHDAIVEASVYAVPDDRLGEEVGATIYCRSALDETDLREFMSAQVARFKIPRYISFTDTPLPRIASGKINKRELRSAVVKTLGKA